MAEFQASKYDSENDTHLPKIGDKFDNDTKEIIKVEPIQASDLMKMFQSETQPDDAEHLTVFDNPIRPFLKYLVWFKDISVTKDETNS